MQGTRTYKIQLLYFCLLCGLILATPAFAKRGKHNTVKAAMNEYGNKSREKLSPYFKLAKVKYPPKELTLIGLKEEKQLFVFAPDAKGVQKLVKVYPVIDASGVAGPKLKEGDKQVPEGFYKITGFKPNSIAHLALLVNYPNKFDKKNARIEKRTNIGSDIEIHGSYWSTGCLAMGDPAIEEIFVLAHDTGIRGIKFILAPCNMNIKDPEIDLDKQPDWLKGLYKELAKELSKYTFVKDKFTNHRWNHHSKFY